MIKLLFPLLLLICVILIACEAGTEKKQQVAATPAPQAEPSLLAFTDTLSKLDKNASAIIERAVKLYDVLSPHDSTGADSAAAALLLFIKDVVAKENDSLLRSGADFRLLPDPVGQTLNEKQKAVKSSLHANRLKLVDDGEGGVYVTPAYETILPTLKARTSDPVDNYLDLLAKEDTAQTFRDGALAIEMVELADRLVMSEQLMKQTLPAAFAADAARLNQFYTHALVTGADNTPSIAYNTTTLNEDFRKGYDYLLAKYPASNAANNIHVWLAVVASGEKKKIDAYRKTLR